MPTFNRAYIIGKAINTILAQTDANWELIIVDDGSSDNTKQVIDDLRDNRIRYIYQKNAGVAEARNTGLASARGEWIAYLDSDNELLPEYLEVMHTQLSSHSDKVFALPRMNRPLELYENGVLVKTIFREERTHASELTVHDIFMYNFHVDTNGFIHHRKVYEDGIRWDPTLPLMEDWDLALSIGSKYPNGFLYVNKILGTYYQRFGGDGIRSNGTYADSAQSFEMIYQKHKNDKLMEGQTWHPFRVDRWRQRQREYEEGKLPPFSHFYFLESE